MKIWLDLSPIYSNSGKDCTSSYMNVEPLSITEDIRWIPTSVFMQTAALYVKQFDHGRWLVCHPTGSGRIVVLDSFAYFLFEQFQTPATLLQVLQAVPNWPVEAVERAIAFFLKLGFLQNLYSASSVHEWREDESLTAWMHITNACNLRCPYCYLQKTSENMADDTARRSVNAIFRSASRHNIKHVKLKYAGGEASALFIII